MKACGIVVEYNPLHFGHCYHIKKAKEITNCDVLIAVMSAIGHKEANLLSSQRASNPCSTKRCRYSC